MKKGFSLTEILVSIAIIGILSGIGIQAFVASRQRARLEEDVAKVVQALRKAQNSALAPSRSTANLIKVNNKICSIVLRIDTKNKTLTTFYTIGEIGMCSVVNKFRTYGVGDKLNYSDIDGTGNIDISFEVPFADTAQKSVTLTRGDGSNTISKTITVTPEGLIKVE